MPMPTEVEELYIVLQRQLAMLRTTWEASQTFFADPTALAVIRELAAGSFMLIRQAFRHELIMGFSRITDPAATAGKDNLTLKQLLRYMDRHAASQVILDQLRDLEKQIDGHCEPIRKLRNRTVGHLDLKTVLDTHPEPLPDVDREHVIVALRLLELFMNEVLGYYRPGVWHDYELHMSGTPRDLVHILTNFPKYQEAYFEKERRELLGG
jgi:AbiU2